MVMNGIGFTFVFCAASFGRSALAESEQEYYRLATLPVPNHTRFEVSGLSTLPDGRLAAATRNGEIWLMERACDNEGQNATYRRFASGLHEPLGLACRDDSFYTVQRTELTRIRDRDGDGLADEYLTVAKGWGVTGNYHEYAFGPKFDRAGNAWITLNSTLGQKVEDDSDWRGWGIRVAPDGSWIPVAGGMRAPSGLGLNHLGDAFFTDQQGNWVPTCSLHHLRPGAFFGHTDALKYCSLPGATFKHPGALPQNLLIPEAARRMSVLKLPAVWFPYRKMGMSSTDVVLDNTGGRFGPFENQLFVGEFTISMVTRVFLEKVKGEYQGACFPFRKGFQCAVLRMEFGSDGSMFVGQSNRGWNSLGTRSFGLQRLIWTGQTPFEIHSMRALPDGFSLRFTQPVERTSASSPDAYELVSYTYLYHSAYGSPEMDTRRLPVKSTWISNDGCEVRLKIDGLREGYVHELRIHELKSAAGISLLHAEVYYTLNHVPD